MSRIAAALALLLLATPALAEGAGMPGDPAAAAEAPHFLATTGKLGLADNLVETMRLYIVAALDHHGLDFATRAELAQTLILPDVRAALPRLLDQWAGIYAAQISADDMRAIEAFYQTEAGRHLLTAQDAIASSTRTVTLNWQVAAVREAVASHIEALRARGYQE